MGRGRDAVREFATTIPRGVPMTDQRVDGPAKPAEETPARTVAERAFERIKARLAARRR